MEAQVLTQSQTKHSHGKPEVSQLPRVLVSILHSIIYQLWSMFWYFCSACTTNISFPYYFTVIHGDKHFYLYSCCNQEKSQLLVIRNSVNSQQSYTTFVPQPGRETEQITLLSGMWWLAIPPYVLLGRYYYNIHSAIIRHYTFWLHFILLDDGSPTRLSRTCIMRTILVK